MTEEEFNATIAIAIDRGDIANKDEISFKKSGHWGLNFVLKDENGKILTRVDENAVDLKVDPSLADQFPSLYKKDNSREKAVAWAQSMGYVIPSKMGGCSTTFFVALGLIFFIVPGLIILFWVWSQGNQYERDINALVAKWVDAGKPEVGEAAKPLERLEKVEEKITSSTSTETRIEELISMRDKGLISEEEYETLRKKALGL